MAEKKTVYLRNKDLLEEVVKSKKVGTMSNKLAQMFQLLCDRYGRKGSYVNYTYNEDMRAYAMLMLVKTWHAFDQEKSSNAFAFYTQCVKNSFIQYLNYEQRHRDIRDLSLIEEGLAPSYGYEEDTHFVEDEEDYNNIRKAANNLNKTVVETIIETDTGAEEENLSGPVTVEKPKNLIENEDLEI